MGHEATKLAAQAASYPPVEALAALISGDTAARDRIAQSAGTSGEYLYQVAAGRRRASAEVAMAIEAATDGAATCDQVRPDLHWVRDNGIVVGYITPLDGNEPGYAAQCVRNDGEHFSRLRALRLNSYTRDLPGDVDEKPLCELAAQLFPTLPAHYQGYIAGQVNEWGAPALEEIGATFRGVTEWNDDALHALFAAGQRAADDRTFHWCFGMTQDFTDAARTALFEKFGCYDHQNFPPSRAYELWDEAQRIRREHPEQIDPEKARPIPASAPTPAATALDIFHHPLSIKPNHLPDVMPGLNISWVPSLRFDAPPSLETPYATVDDALNDITGLIKSAIQVLSCEDMAKLTSGGWSAVHLLSLSLELHRAVHSTLLQLTQPGAEA